jgi:hypothetical protein
MKRRGRALSRRYGHAKRTRIRRSSAHPVPAQTAASLKSHGYEFWRHHPVLDSGHFDNLVYDDGKHRVWVSRMTLDDYGGDRQAWLAERLTVEELVDGRWERV